MHEGQSLLMEEVLSGIPFIVRFPQAAAVQKTLGQAVAYIKPDGVFFIVLLEEFFFNYYYYYPLKSQWGFL